MAPTPKKVMRFGVIGVINTAIDFTSFGLFLSLGAKPLLANAAAWFIAMTFSFAANNAWTFKANTHKNKLLSFVQFGLAGAVISLIISTAIIAIAAPHIGVWPAKILAVFISALCSYIAASRIIEGKP